MDAKPFERWARSFSIARSGRRVVRLLTTGALAGLGGAEAAAKNKNKGKGKGTVNTEPPRLPGSSRR